MCLKFYQSLTYLLVTLLFSIYSQNVLEDGLRKYGVVPNVLSQAPKEICKVIYYWGDLKMGAELDKISVYIKPYVEWTACNESFYTVYLVAYIQEHYAPSLLNITPEWHQWVLADVPGMDVTLGRDLYEYVGSWGPVRPNTTDIFTFLVYKQPKGKNTYKKIQSGATLNGSHTYLGPLRDFVANYSLGEPICGNYYIINE